MKKLYKYIVLIIGILAFSACNDEVEFLNVVEEEGTNVTLTLNVQAQVNKDVVVSRATAEENKLYDLRFYVFNAQTGKLTGYEYLVFEDGHNLPTLGEDGQGNSITVPVQIRTKTGNSLIYAVANIDKSTTYYLSENLLKVTKNKTIQTTIKSDKTVSHTPIAYTENINSKNVTLEDIVKSSELDLEKFQGIQYNRLYGDASSKWYSPKPQNDVYVMSGYINDGNNVVINTEGIQDEDGNVTLAASNLNTIKLYRILTKNTLTISTSSTANGTFTPKYYRLCNVPINGMLIPNANISTTYGSNDEYLTNSNITDDAIKNIAVESNYIYNLSSSTADIEFYYPENLRLPKSTAKSGTWYWKDRETNNWDYTQNPAAKTFSNADNKAAYIELHGDYVSNSGHITANVSYTIHLGNFSKGRDQKDFNVVRNHHYRYNVIVKDVNDIITEAVVVNDQDNDDNPYAEGLVIDTSGAGSEHFNVDAHYEARVMTFTRPENNNIGYILNISTPFGNTPDKLLVKKENVVENGTTKTKTFIYNALNTKLASLNSDGTIVPEKDENNNNYNLFEGENDYKWIRFVRNGAPLLDRSSGTDKKNSNNMVIAGTESTHTCQYPGDDDKYKYSSTSTGGWLNVFQLLEQLLDNSTYGSDNTATYTCFIDEYYYYDRAWSQFVNYGGSIAPRTMQIANNVYISNDKKSIYAVVKYSLSQRPISTFYQRNYKYRGTDGITDLVDAFGTECVDEEDEYHNKYKNSENQSIKTRLGDDGNNKYGDYNKMTISNQDDWKGWTSANNTNKGKDWYTNYRTDIPGIQPLYNAVAKACMSRNRDLNGDGSITYDSEDPSKNEVRWYLAAIDQYRALYFGQRVLEADVRLISQEELKAINTYWNGSWGSDDKGHNYRGKYHYWTSSEKESAGTFWPEEGLTNNPAQDPNWWGTSSVSRAELVRCIRTLESGSSSNKKYGVKDPEPFYTYENNIFDLSGIVVVRQPEPGSPLGVHNEIDENGYNEFTPYFVVAPDDLSTTHSVENITTGYNNNNNEFIEDPCLNYNNGNYGKGTWRTPNQKEFALMLSNVKNSNGGGYALKNGSYGMRTKFSGNDLARGYWNWHKEAGFKYSGGNINLASGGTYKIRCVRDIISKPTNSTN